MAKSPVFSNDYVTISDTGIDLTRSRFPYKHLDFAEIEEARIQEGYLIKNRIVVLLLSIVAIFVLSFVLHQSGLVPSLFGENTTAAFVIISSRPVLAVVVITLGLGFLIYQSFIRSKVMTIKTRNKTKYSVRLREVKDDLQARSLQEFIVQKTFN